MLGRKDILMNFGRPPSADDLLQIALMHFESMPATLAARCEDLSIQIDEFPDETTESDLTLDDPYDLLCLYKSAREVSPGVQRKVAQGDDVLILYRRPILDMWAETGDDLAGLLRQVMVNEIASQFDMDADIGNVLVQKKTSA